MVRQFGYNRIPEPSSINLDDALLHPELREFLRKGHEGYASQLFSQRKGFIPGLHEALNGDRLIIDLGCGPGDFAGALAARFPNRVIGIDINPRAIEVARRNYPGVPNLEFRVGDFYKIFEMYQGVAGLINVNMVLHNLDKLEEALLGIYGALGEGGIFFFTDLNPGLILKREEIRRVHSARHSMGEEVFVREFVMPIQHSGDNKAMLELAMVMSTIASYTKDEIRAALQTVGFSTLRIKPDGSGEALMGYAIKQHY